MEGAKERNNKKIIKKKGEDPKILASNCMIEYMYDMYLYIQYNQTNQISILSLYYIHMICDVHMIGYIYGLVGVKDIS